MKRLVILLLSVLTAIPAFGQYDWRFSPSYTFEAPAFSKKDLASRADDYRRFAATEYNAPVIYQYDTKHHTSWFMFSDWESKAGKKDIRAIVQFYVTILPDQGKYKIYVERTNVTLRSGMKILLDSEILRADDSVYQDKLTKSAVTQVKAFIQEQFDSLIPKIREIMEDPLDGFRLQEITE